jgi:hypothetical protein
MMMMMKSAKSMGISFYLSYISAIHLFFFLLMALYLNQLLPQSYILTPDILIPWYRASADCLDAFRIKVTALDASQLSNICVNGGSASALVNFIRFDGSAAANALASTLSPQYLVDTSANQDGSSYSLNATIVSSADNTTILDCVISSTNCWSEIRRVLQANTQLRSTLCQELYARAANGLELEQSTVRIAICNNLGSSTAINAVNCTDLLTQIQDISANDTSVACRPLDWGQPATRSRRPVLAMARAAVPIPTMS